MKNAHITIMAAIVVWLGGLGISSADDPVVIAPPKNLRIVSPAVLSGSSVPARPDIAIADVVKEFVSADSDGIYYRYHVIVGNSGGPCRDGRLMIRADMRYRYARHGDIFHSADLMVVALAAGRKVIAPFLINEAEKAGDDPPVLFVVTFVADADDACMESDDTNNTWTCDDAVTECDLCVGDACP
jgi:hypothetical protein